MIKGGGKFFQLQIGKRIFDSLYEVLEESDYFDAKFDCIVSMPFSCTEKVDIVNFSLPIPESPNFELGKFNLYGSKISLSWLDDNRMKLMKLKQQLELEFKIDIEEPSVFIESHIG